MRSGSWSCRGDKLTCTDSWLVPGLSRPHRLASDGGLIEHPGIDLVDEAVLLRYG